MQQSHSQATESRPVARIGFAASALLCMCAATAVAQEYVLYTVPLLPGASGSNDCLYAINNDGFAVGNYNSANLQWRGLVFKPGFGVALVGTYFDAPNGGSQAWCVNSAGEVGGQSQVPSGGCTRAIATTVTSPMTLQPLNWAGGGTAAVYGINQTGIRVGYANLFGGCSDPFGNPTPSGLNTNPGKAVRWVGQQVSVLPSLGGFASVATGVNDNGDIVGFELFVSGSTMDFTRTRAFLLPAGASTPMQLCSLGGSSDRAYSITGSGVLTGFSADADGNLTAVKWTSNGDVLSLGRLPGYRHSVANGSTPDGRIVVGSAAKTAGSGPGYDYYMQDSNVLVYGRRAVLYAEGCVVDLNDHLSLGSGVILEAAFGINSSGWICGWLSSNGVRQGYVLVPCAPLIARQPTALAVPCPTGNAVFTTVVIDASAHSFAWQRETSPGVWNSLTNGANPGFGTVSGATTAELRITAVTAGNLGRYRCQITNACGTSTTDAVSLSAITRQADLNGDGIVNTIDLVQFLGAFGKTSCE